MMNIPETTGESSCKRHENGDGSTSSERPLKKARFAWQVKGKYHLKNDTSESDTSTQHNECEAPGSSSQGSATKLVGNTEQNLEILGDYLLKQDFNTIDSVITDSDKSLLKSNSSISTGSIEYPRYVSTFERNAAGNSGSSRSVDRLIPMSMVTSHAYNEDQCIARWQARQIAKGFVDNTINRVLDRWLVAPLPADIDNRFLALDVAEFINNLPGDNSIENEGILMAISAHGLQNSSSSNNDIIDEEKIAMPITKDDRFGRANFPQSSDDRAHFACTKDDVFTSRSSSLLQADEESKTISVEDTINTLDTNISSLNDLNMAWQYDDEREIDSSHASLSLYPDSSSPSSLLYCGGDTLQNSSVEFEENASSSENDMLTSHFDFMDAAVSFAIQNKGLTSFGTDYG